MAIVKVSLSFSFDILWSTFSALCWFSDNNGIRLPKVLLQHCPTLSLLLGMQPNV